MRGLFRRVAAATDGVVLLGGLLAAIPVVVAAAHAVDARWTPSSDDAMIALRAFDVLGPHPPLVGQYSQSSPLIGESVYSLGPMLYWLLALPAHVGPHTLPVAIGAVNGACVVGSVLLAGRRGGRGLALVTAVLLVLTTRALPVEIPYEVWNCWAGVFPFTFLLFLAWSVASGDHRLLPLLALTASYLIQVHFTYLVPALGATLVAVAGLVLHRRGQPAGRVKPWAIAAVLVALVCWMPPLIDEATNSPGNLTLAHRLAVDDHQTLGGLAGRKAAARSIGVMPLWALDSRTQAERLLGPLYVSTARMLSAYALFAALGALLVVALRRRRADLIAALVLALVLVLSMAVVGAAIPVGTLGLSALGYVLVWTVPAGMFVWLVAGWSAWALAGRRSPSVPVAPALLVVGALGILVAAGRDYEDPERFPPGVKDYRLVQATVDEVIGQLGGTRSVALDSPLHVQNSLTFQSAIAYGLRREGFTIGAPPRLDREMGDQYELGDRDFDQVVVIRDPDAPAPPGSRVVVRNHEVSVMLMPWTQRASRSSAR